MWRGRGISQKQSGVAKSCVVQGVKRIRKQMGIILTQYINRLSIPPKSLMKALGVKKNPSANIFSPISILIQITKAYSAICKYICIHMSMFCTLCRREKSCKKNIQAPLYVLCIQKSNILPSENVLLYIYTYLAYQSWIQNQSSSFLGKIEIRF